MNKLAIKNWEELEDRIPAHAIVADVDADGEIDIIGYHQDGDLDPYQWEYYEG